MQTAGYTPTAGVTYPTSALGKALHDLAWVIKSNIGLQIACLDYGNWDMHTNIGKPGDTTGWMHRQLADVAACLAAFAKDLGPTFAKVNVVTLSEFGRRAAENGDGGADHGLGQAVLAFGGGINGGQVIGAVAHAGPGCAQRRGPRRHDGLPLDPRRRSSPSAAGSPAPQDGLPGVLPHGCRHRQVGHAAPSRCRISWLRSPELGDCEPVVTPDAGSFCERCGPRPTRRPFRLRRALQLEPPRYCRICARRMVVQVTPSGLERSCSRHGLSDGRQLGDPGQATRPSRRSSTLRSCGEELAFIASSSVMTPSRISVTRCWSKVCIP